MCQKVDSIILHGITVRYKNAAIFEGMGCEKFLDKLYKLLHSI
jgi:hypothetical protein